MRKATRTKVPLTSGKTGQTYLKKKKKPKTPSTNAFSVQQYTDLPVSMNIVLLVYFLFHASFSLLPELEVS